MTSGSPLLRTLVIHPMLAPYRVDLFNALAERLDFEVVFQRRELSYHKTLDQDALRSALRCRFGYLEGNIVVLDRDFPAGIPRLIRDRRPDVVVTSEFSLPTFLAGRARGRGRGRFGHVIWSDENPHTLEQHRAMRRFLRWLCTRRVDGMVMCSELVADRFAQRFGVERSRIRRVSVHQSPDTLRQRWRDASEAAQQLISRHNLAGRRVLLYVGRLAPVKNLERCLRCFESFSRERNQDVVLVLVGSGEQRAALERQAGESAVRDRVIFAGHCEGAQLYAWYRMAAALILPSVHEPYGAVVNEALACGIPVLCSDRAGAAHLVRTGENGYVFSPFDPAEMEVALQRIEPGLMNAGRACATERPDLMPMPFSEDVDNFVAVIRAAARVSGGVPERVA